MDAVIEDEAAPGSISLAAAAELLGVHYMTAYRYVRTGRMIATKQRGQWWVRDDDLARVVAEGTGVRRSLAPTDRAADPRSLLVEPFLTRLLAGDTGGCWELISDALRSGATPVEVHQLFLQNALVQVGERWRNGEVSVAEEHRATASAHRLIGQMAPLFRRPGRRRGSVVVGAVSGDHHALPSALISDMLRDRRFDVVDLGAHTPVESFVEVASGADNLIGIGLCVAIDECVATVYGQAVELRRQFPSTTLVVGGPAMSHSDTSAFAQVPAAVSESAEHACAIFEAGIHSA